MLIKQKSPSLPGKLALRTFGELLIVFSVKVNLLYLLNSLAWRCYLLHLIKQNYLLKTFLRTLILMTLESLDNLGTSLPVFSLELIWNCIIFPNSQDGWKGYNEPWFIKGIWSNCIPVVVLKNWKPKLSYILADLFSMCQKESCFPDF